MIKIITEKLSHRKDDPCYLVDNEKIYSKLYALKKAQKLCNGDNSVWGHIKFENYIKHIGPEPEHNLRQLYKARAIHLRQQNEYVRIWASGGADSTNVINAFLEAKIKPDEVATYMQYPGAIHASQNAEVDFSLRPFIEKLKQVWPDVKFKFYDVLPEHYNWYSNNALEHYTAYTQLHPPAFSWQVAYEVYPELQEHSQRYQTANIFSGTDFSIGVDVKGWYYRFVDKPYNEALNAPYQVYFYSSTDAKDLWLKIVHTARKHIMEKAEDKTVAFEDQMMGEWSIKTGGLPEMDFWLPESIAFGRKKNKANWSGILNWGPKGSLRLHNMISSVTGETTLMNTLHYFKELNLKYPHWFTNDNIMEDWIGMKTDKVYFNKT